MAKVRVEVTDREERDWSEDEALLALQQTSKPAPDQFAADETQDAGLADPLAESEPTLA